MQYNVIAILILVSLIYQVTEQSDPTSSPQSTPSQNTPTENTLTEGTPSAGTPTEGTPTQSTPTQSTPTQRTPTQSTPTQSTPTQSTPNQSTPSQSTPTQSTSTQSTPASGSGTDNLPCIKNIFQLCESHQFMYNKVGDEYGCTSFTNPYLFAFHINLVQVDLECDTIMELEVMRQNVMTNKGQPGPSTHPV